MEALASVPSLPPTDGPTAERSIGPCGLDGCQRYSNTATGLAAHRWRAHGWLDPNPKADAERNRKRRNRERHAREAREELERIERARAARRAARQENTPVDVAVAKAVHTLTMDPADRIAASMGYMMKAIFPDGIPYQAVEMVVEWKALTLDLAARAQEL